MAPAPYGQLERDLCRLSSDRASASLHSVLQLCETPEQRLMVAIHASQGLLAIASGIFSAKHPEISDDPIALGKVVLDLMEGAQNG
jgi:hypothetical protein